MVYLSTPLAFASLYCEQLIRMEVLEFCAPVFVRLYGVPLCVCMQQSYGAVLPTAHLTLVLCHSCCAKAVRRPWGSGVSSVHTCYVYAGWARIKVAWQQASVLWHPLFRIVGCHFVAPVHPLAWAAVFVCELGSSVHGLAICSSWQGPSGLAVAVRFSRHMVQQCMCCIKAATRQHA